MHSNSYFRFNRLSSIIIILSIALSNTMLGAPKNDEWRAVLESTIAQTITHTKYRKAKLSDVFTNVDNLPEDKADLLFASDTILVTYKTRTMFGTEVISIITSKYHHCIFIDYDYSKGKDKYGRALSGLLKPYKFYFYEQNIFVDEIFNDEFADIYDKYGEPLDLLNRCLYLGKIPPPEYVWKYYFNLYWDCRFEAFRIIRGRDNSFSIEYYLSDNTIRYIDG